MCRPLLLVFHRSEVRCDELPCHFHHCMCPVPGMHTADTPWSNSMPRSCAAGAATSDRPPPGSLATTTRASARAAPAAPGSAPATRLGLAICQTHPAPPRPLAVLPSRRPVGTRLATCSLVWVATRCRRGSGPLRMLVAALSSRRSTRLPLRSRSHGCRTSRTACDRRGRAGAVTRPAEQARAPRGQRMVCTPAMMGQW
jgi:hypothetical protein